MFHNYISRLSTLFLTLIFILSSGNIAWAQLAGSYTIGSGGNYPTINAAVSDLMANGISASVTFNIINGTYNEQVRIGTVPGVSASNTITIQSQSGNASDVEIYFSPTSLANYIFSIDTVDYVTIKNITLTNTGSSYGRIFELKNKAENITIENNILNGINVNSSSTSYAIIYSDPANGQESNHLNILNNTFNFGGYGIYIQGNSNSYLSDIKIQNNSFVSGYGGVYLLYTMDVNIKNNQMSDIYYYGLYLNYCDGASRITNNRIQQQQGYGIYLSSNDGGTPPVGQHGLIANNFIAVGGTSSYGMYIFSSSNIDVFFNSIHLYQSTSANTAAVYLYNSNTINLMNNNLAASAGGVVIINQNSSFQSDYNNFYTSGTILAKNGNTNLNRLKDWQTSMGTDQHSLDVYPHFTTTSDLHSKAPWLDGKGTPLSEVSEDIDGQPRSATPDIGADEFTPDAGTTTPMAGNYTVGSGADYGTLAEAASDLLLKGVSDSVKLQVTNGTHIENATFYDIPGTSLQKPVIVTAQSGNSADAQIFYNASGTGDNYVIQLFGARNIVFRDITLSANNSNNASYGRVVNIIGGTDSIRIESCQLNGSPVSSSSNNLSVIYSNNTLFSSFTVSDNEINYGAYAVELYSNNSMYSDGVNIKNNVVNNTYGGIKVIYLSNLKIENNQFTNINYYGLYLQYCDGAFRFTNNQMQQQQGYGIYLSSSDGGTPPVGQHGLIANNFIAVGGTSSYGIYIYGSSNIDVFFNSIHLYQSTSAQTAAVYLYNSNTISMKNNILAASAGGVTLNNSNSSSIELDYNDYYTTGTKLADWGGDIADLAALQLATGQDSNSISVNPNFVSDTDLHINNSPVDSSGVALSNIDYDIDYDARDSSFPDMGADEFDKNATAIDDKDFVAANLPKAFKLEQNFPNPFNPQTTIRYALKENSQVRITIYNVLGQKVHELLNKKQVAGNYEVIFNGQSLTSGVYFYRIDTNTGFSKIKKMILIK